jgi:hypothetical protein
MTLPVAMNNPLALVMIALAACEKSYEPDWSGVSIENQLIGVYCRITEDEEHIDVTFRGTNESKDWIINLLAFPWWYGGACVHLGFALAHWAIWPQVRAEIERRGAKKKLRIFGHSMGAQLAEYSCLFLKDYPRLVSLVCFGKPNGFLKPRKARLSFLMWQISVILGSDMVARIPRIFFGPDLGQMMLYLANNGFAHWGDATDPDFRALRVRDFNLFRGISNHLLPAYRARLEQVTA